MELSELSEYIDAEVNALCVEGDVNNGVEQAFTDVFLKYLSGAGDVDSYDLCYAQRTGRKNAPAFKLNAWYFAEAQGDDGDEKGASPVIDLFVTLYKPGLTGEVIPSNEAALHFTYVRNYLEQAIKNIDSFEESSEHYHVASMIHANRDTIDSARIFLITNSVVSDFNNEDTDILGVSVKYTLWDMEKFHRMRSSGVEREPILIDLVNDFGGAVPCLEKVDESKQYSCYLAFLPATLLASIYSKFGPRLLEKNVRSFLQAKGKINKGIQLTIKNEPQRFLPYNNGLSCTADKIVVKAIGEGHCMLETLHDFQIVNGGQTTASIYHAAKKEKLDISSVTIQVKITVVHENSDINEFVPNISKYANSQNKINNADLHANDKWHHALESLSRIIWAPPKNGMGKGTKWFYERARGAYLDQRLRSGTPAKIKLWEKENPIDQKFTKTDIAKYEQIFNQYPHIASRGAEKNFYDWTLQRIKGGDKQPSSVDFESLCAKALIIRRAEQIVQKLQLGGYRSNVVAYSIAWICRYIGSPITIQCLLGEVWKLQTVTDELSDAIQAVAPHIFKTLVQSAGSRNVTEFAKSADCCKVIMDLKIEEPILKRLRSFSNASSADVVEFLDYKKMSVGDLKRHVFNVSSDVWLELKDWIEESKKFEKHFADASKMFHRKVINNATLASGEMKMMLDLLQRARLKGF